MAAKYSEENVINIMTEDAEPSRKRNRCKQVEKTSKTKKKPKVTKWKCEICKKEFADKYSLRNHEQLHSSARPFSCPKCTYTCKTRKYLTRHNLKVHSTPTEHQCSVCGKMFHFKSNLETHMRVHTGEKPNKCDVCGKAFNSAYSLSTHKYIHTDEKPFQCSFCDYACRDSSTLRKHQDRHMGLEKVYQCKLCERRCKSKFHLKMHVAEAHLAVDVNKHKCTICGRGFKEKSRLTVHIRSVHERGTMAKCEVCGRESTTPHNLRAHMRTHLSLRPYRCTFRGCTNTYKDVSSLKKHSITHVPSQQFPCPHCGRLFSRRSRLETHVATHRPRRKGERCPMCGDRFYSERYLSRHIARKHCRKRRKYICDMCDFVTTNKPSLVMHIKHGHRTDNKMECSLCGKVYKRREHLSRHYWSQHQVQDEYYGLENTKIKKRSAPKIKEEPESECSEEEIDLLEIDKEEIQEEQTPKPSSPRTTVQIYARDELSSDTARDIISNNRRELGKVPEAVFDDFFIEAVIKNPDEKKEVTREHIDRETEKYANKCVDEMVAKLRREHALEELEGARRKYNDRMKVAVKAVPKPNVKIKFFVNNKQFDENKEITEDNNSQAKSPENCENDDQKSDEGDDKTVTKTKKYTKLKLNTHQCYICYKLFETKAKLLNHCKDHFEICNKVTLKKCPLCDFVTNNDLRRHMRLIHKVDIKLFYGKINEKDTKNGSKYTFNVKNKNIKEIEIIPSVKNLNKQACLKVDRINREMKAKSVAKTKLVKKGDQWIVEKQNIRVNAEDFLLPEFSDKDLETVKDDGKDYIERMKKLYKIAKKNGAKMMFPCESCDKICQTLSALKLHNRKHDPNKKPFKPKIWKHKQNKSQKPTPVKRVKVNTENRFADPKPIVNKHKCDDRLKDFYKNNIKGGDIEFWQFLKIYNKMDRENVKDFKDLENSVHFGIHTIVDNVVPEKKTVVKVKEVKKVKRKNAFTRVLRISKEEYEKRNAIKQILREKASLVA